MRTSAQKVVLAFRLTGAPGQRKLSALLNYVREHGLDWHVHLVRNPNDFSELFVNSLPERKIDGVVFSMPEARKGAAALAKLDIPTVALDLYDDTLMPGRKRNLVYIHGSTDTIGQMVARNLMSQGCFRTYGYVPDQKGYAWSRLRGESFEAEIKANGLTVSRFRSRRKDYDLPALATWLAKLPKPAGVFAANDDRAAQVIEACCEAGLSIPDEIAVVGVDNDETLCMNTTPPLTSVLPDHEEAGRLAARYLAEMMGGRVLTSPIRQSVGVREIIVRESTSAVSNAGRLVQRALAFIRIHAAEAVKPRDVVAHLKVSRRLADLRFRELQGESIGEAILRERLKEVRRRLLATNDTIENIATRCQFAKLCRLNEAFTAAYGLTMKDLRRKTAQKAGRA